MKRRREIMEGHAKLYFTPKICVTAEHAAGILGCSIEKADQVLSRPDTNELLKIAMHDAVQKALVEVLQAMVRTPHESVPTRIDCVAKLPILPTARVFNQS